MRPRANPTFKIHARIKDERFFRALAGHLSKPFLERANASPQNEELAASRAVD
jgi:hypothetical protein